MNDRNEAAGLIKLWIRQGILYKVREGGKKKERRRKKCDAVVECFYIDIIYMLFIRDSRKNKKDNLVYEIFIVFAVRFGKVC